MIRITAFLLGLTLVAAACGDSSGEDNGRDPLLGGSGGDGGPGGNGGAPAALQCWESDPLGGELGGNCRTNGDAKICNTGLLCVESQTVAVGGPDDPIANFPEGPDGSFEYVEFAGDYCVAAVDETGCDPEVCASECGDCIPYFIDADVCFKLCLANGNDNSACRDGYQCDPWFLTCMPGCLSDNDCLVFRNAQDQLVYDTESSAYCNLETFRCEHAGTTDAEAGIACSDSEDCEANGVCLSEGFGFPGGYCSKVGCDLEGIGCEGDAVCRDIGLDPSRAVPVCVSACTVGTGVTPGDPSTYLGNSQGCRQGYTCVWDAQSADPSGYCDVGVFNEVLENNIGDACETAQDCYSPFGNGYCLKRAPGEAQGTCTVLECDATGMPEDLCGEAALCVSFRPTAALGLCMRQCSRAEDCAVGQACVDLDADGPGLEQTCFPNCIDASECRSGEICDLDPQSDVGVCTAGS